MSDNAVKLNTWTPAADILPSNIHTSGSVILLPTLRDEKNNPCFEDDLFLIPKEARRAGYDVQFSDTSTEPEFLAQHDFGPEVLQFVFAIIPPITETALNAINWIIARRAESRGIESNKLPSHPLNVKIAKMTPEGGIEGLELNGNGADVNEALKTLRENN